VVLLAGYLGFFLVFFWGIHGGVGQYWDWTFPYFKGQVHNIFAAKDSAWVNADNGSPLGYSTDYFFRFIMSLFVFMQPEIAHYVLLAAIFAAGAAGMYLLVRPYVGRALALLLGLAAFINPAVFYKYTAGHFNYFLSYTLFIYLLYFLLHKFGKNLRSAVIAGLLLAFIGIQIQFFVIAGIFLIAYLVFNREKFAWKYAAVMGGVVFGVNLVWLTNFLTGAASTEQTGAAAAKVSVKGSSASDFLSIFTFSFSKATLLSRFYAFYELLWNASLFIFLLWLLARQKSKERFDVLLLVFLAVMIFLATGMYQVLNLGPATTFYPMFREVGHFAPVIVVVSLLLVARLLKGTPGRWIFMGVLVGSLFIVGVKFQYFSQKYSFADTRSRFASFESVLDQDHGTYRVLAYPFFDQYSLQHAPTDPPGLQPLKNTGHDSFAAYNTQAFVNNQVPPYKFQSSPQYKLLQTYDVDVLRPYDVKYIFDLSDIYHSNYNMYVPASTYNGDLSLIKNDPHFFDKLLAHNPGRLRKVNDHVLEITDKLPRMNATAQLFSVAADDPAADQGQVIDPSLFTRSQLNRAFDYIADDPSLGRYTTQLTSLFAGSTAQLDKPRQTFTQTVQVPDGGKTTLYTNDSYRTLYYQATATALTVYTQSAPSLLVNGQALAGAGTARQAVAQVPLSRGTAYYLSFAGTITAVRAGSSGNLGTGKAGDTVDVLSGTNGNLVANPSFEQGLWDAKVGDCNNYDNNGDVGMKPVSGGTDGHTALELSAARHDACTSAPVTLEADTQYLLSFDYQSDNAPTANFYLGYSNDVVPVAKGSRAITDRGWHTATAIINAPSVSGRARLFLYALEGDGHVPNVNHYDNVRLVKLDHAASVTLPSAGSNYAAAPLPPGTQTLTFRDENYQYKNLIANPSFEQGAWQAKPADCNNYDPDPRIALRMDTANKTDGKQSVILSAAHHDACLHTSTNVRDNTDYLLTFDYQTGPATEHYGYAVSFDNPGATVGRNVLDGEGPGWHTATTKVHVPAGSTTLTLYLYAFESNGQDMNIVRYDNVNLAELPDFANRFYLVRTPAVQLKAPRRTQTTTVSQTVRHIAVAGATSPFFVSLSETYHPGWQLELGGSSASRIVPMSSMPSAGQHVRLSGLTNAWLIDPATLCKTNPKGCTREADGSYDLDLTAEFLPQRWFAIGTVVSWLVVIGCISYVLLVRPKELPTFSLKKRGK
jgi:hypothetical protein